MLFDDVVVQRGARVRTAVIDERSVVRRGAVVGEAPSRRVAHDDDLVLVGMSSSVGRGLVPAGSRLEPGTTT